MTIRNVKLHPQRGEAPVTRNQLCARVKEGDRTIIERLLIGGYLAWDPAARKGGGYKLTARGLKIACQNGSIVLYDISRTAKALSLTLLDTQY
jgi:hypothetical protein